MIRQVEYDSNDIETFLEINKNAEETQDSQTLKKLLSVQKKISIIANIDTDELKVILDKLRFIKYKFKDFIITQGETSQEIFFILSGECHIFVDNNQVASIKKGETFGESAAIFQTKRNASVVCATKETTVLAFSINHENTEFCSSAIATLYKNLAHQINTKLEQMNELVAKKHS